MFQCVYFFHVACQKWDDNQMHWDSSSKELNFEPDPIAIHQVVLMETKWWMAQHCNTLPQPNMLLGLAPLWQSS